MKLTIGSKNITKLGVDMELAMPGDVDTAWATLIVNAILTLYRHGAEQIFFQDLKEEIGEYRCWEGGPTQVLTLKEFWDLDNRNLLEQVPCYLTQKPRDLKEIARSEKYPAIMYSGNDQ